MSRLRSLHRICRGATDLVTPLTSSPLYSTARDVDRMEKMAKTINTEQSMRQFNLKLIDLEPSHLKDDKDSVHAFDKLLTLCGESGDDTLALELIDHMQRSGLDVGYVALGSVLKAFCRGSKPDRAIEYLKNIAPRERTEIMFTTVLSSCVFERKPELFERCWEWMKGESVAIAATHWVLRLRMSDQISLQTVRTAWEEHEVAMERGIASWTAYICGLAHWGEASEAWSNVKEMFHRFPLSNSAGNASNWQYYYSLAYNAVLGGCVISKEWGLSEEIVHKIGESCFQKNVQMYNQILAIYCSSGRPFKELKVKHLDEFCRALNVYHWLECMGGDESKGHQMLTLYLQMATEISQDEPLLLRDGTYLAVHARFRSERQILQPGAEGCDTGVIPDIRCYNEMLTSCALTANLQKCKETYESLQRSGLKPDLCTFFALFSTITAVVTRTGGGSITWAMEDAGNGKQETGIELHAQLREWECEMCERLRLKMNVLVLTALVKAYGRLIAIPDVMRLMDTARKNGPQPGVNAYSLAITSLAIAGKAQECLALYRKMSEDGVNPHLRIFNGLLLLFRGKAPVVEYSWEDVLGQMRVKGVAPNDFTYRILTAVARSELDLDRVAQLMAYSEPRPSLYAWLMLMRRCIDTQSTPRMERVLTMMHSEERNRLAEMLDDAYFSNAPLFTSTFLSHLLADTEQES